MIQPPSPTGSFTFNAIGSDLPGTANTGTPFASFLLGQVQTFSIDLQQDQIQERAQLPGVLRPGRLAGHRPPDHQPRAALHAELPVHRDQRPDGRLQPADAAARIPGRRAGAAAEEEQLRPAAGRRSTVLTDKTLVSAGYGLVWIEMAGITTPFTTPTFPFLQTVSQRALDTITPAFVLQNGPTVAPIGPTPTAGLGQGVFSVDGTLGSGYVQQWNASVQRELTSNIIVEVAYVGSKITHVGIPDTNLNQLTVEQLALGAPLLQRVDESRISASSRARRRSATRRLPSRSC